MEAAFLPARMPRSPTETGWLLSRQGVAADSAGGFVALDLGKQPHPENHEQTEKGNDVLNAIVPQHMLEIKSNRRHQDDKQRKAKLDFYRHCLFSQPITTSPPTLGRRSSPGPREPASGCPPIRSARRFHRVAAAATPRKVRARTAGPGRPQRSAC